MSWKSISLGEALSVKHGFAFKSTHFSRRGSYVVLTPGNFYECGGFRLRTAKDRYYAGDFSEEYILDERDIVVAMTEQGPGLLGSSAIVPEGNLYLHNQRIGLVTDLDESILDRTFTYYLFNTRDVRAQISGSASGTKIRHTSPRRIGSGSHSMVFFSRKVHRKLGGNFTFLVLCDRDDLDNQIYRTYAGCGVVGEHEEVRAGSGRHLKRLLGEHKAYVFSLIQKFNRDVMPDEPYSEPDDIIVIVDEAHRTQYGQDPAPLYDISAIDFERLRQEFARSTTRTRRYRISSTPSRNALPGCSRRIHCAPTSSTTTRHWLPTTIGKGARDDWEKLRGVLKFVSKLDDEQARVLREGLDEPTLALFDLLKKEELTPADIKRIKQVAVDLYATLRQELARIRDWEQKQATRDQVRQTIFDFLYSDETGLPESYSEDEITTKSNLVFGHFLTQQQHGLALAAG